MLPEDLFFWEIIIRKATKAPVFINTLASRSSLSLIQQGRVFSIREYAHSFSNHIIPYRSYLEANLYEIRLEFFYLPGCIDTVHFSVSSLPAAWVLEPYGQRALRDALSKETISDIYTNAQLSTSFTLIFRLLLESLLFQSHRNQVIIPGTPNAFRR